jgi:hypothetical protein
MLGVLHQSQSGNRRHRHGDLLTPEVGNLGPPIKNKVTDIKRFSFEVTDFFSAVLQYPNNCFGAEFL